MTITSGLQLGSSDWLPVTFFAAFDGATLPYISFSLVGSGVRELEIVQLDPTDYVYDGFRMNCARISIPIGSYRKYVFIKHEVISLVESSLPMARAINLMCEEYDRLGYPDLRNNPDTGSPSDRFSNAVWSLISRIAGLFTQADIYQRSSVIRPDEVSERTILDMMSKCAVDQNSTIMDRSVFNAAHEIHTFYAQNGSRIDGLMIPRIIRLCARMSSQTKSVFSGYSGAKLLSVTEVLQMDRTGTLRVEDDGDSKSGIRYVISQNGIDESEFCTLRHVSFYANNDHKPMIIATDIKQ